MKASLIAGILAASLLSLAAPAGAIQPTGQPLDEAAAQKALPQANDPLWVKFVRCTLSYDEDTGIYRIRMTPEVKALNGKTVTMRGFVMPMDGSDRTRHFLLSRNTPVCMYCPPGQPNEVVEVRSSRTIAWTDKVVSVTGKLNLVNDEERAIFFKMENAEVK
jgi:hypothetical protein